MQIARAAPNLLLWSLLFGGARAVAAGDASEYQVKAAFLLNFPGFVEWPANSFPAAGEPIVLGIYGKDPFGGALTRMASAKTINGRSFLIRVLSDPNELRTCHVVFFPATQKTELAPLLGELGILTIGESAGFAERGGIVNFVIEDRHVRFEVNPTAAERGRLKMSSKLLQLAIIVGPGPARK